VRLLAAALAVGAGAAGRPLDRLDPVDVRDVGRDPRAPRLDVRAGRLLALHLRELPVEAVADRLDEELLDLARVPLLGGDVRRDDGGAELEPGGLEAGEGRPFARAVDADERLEEPGVGEGARLAPRLPDRARPLEGLPDLGLVALLDPGQHGRDLPVLQRLPRRLDDGAVEGVAVGERPGGGEQDDGEGDRRERGRERRE
jgi:hypothetical protein